MTHVVLATVGSAGDVVPLVGLGAELRARGHRVSVLTNPYFRGVVERADLELVPTGTVADFERAMRDPDLWHPTRALRAVAREAILPTMRPMYEYIAGLDPASTVLVASGLAFGPRLAQERLGFRLATVHLQPTLFMSAHDNAEMGPVKAPDWLPVGFHAWRLAQLERRFVDPLMAPDLNAFRAELGLAPVTRIFGRWMHSPDRVLGLFPDWFAPPQPDWPRNLALTGFVDHRDDDAPLGPELEEFLAAGEPPVVFTPGSANLHGARFFAAAVGAARRLGRRAVLLTRFREQLPAELPPGVLPVEWANLPRLLPRAAAMVYHGGIGTLAQTLNAGIPHLVVPFAHDQPDNANRLIRLGVGDRLGVRGLTAARLAAKLDRLLTDPAVAARCAEYATRVDYARSARETCDVIEAL
ncbi:glycosyltransferase [Georgenia yuyongxinii]|uniref:glycosyltransferase n=1 Tax=Georgenia yuyongxinii TaxID=2589797 RepID=UPI00143D3D89|nr:glycosyltransferase [Georgenia yuyongxinii]